MTEELSRLYLCVLKLALCCCVAGVRKLYHGVGYSIPRAIIGSGSHFVFYETTRKLLLRDQRALRQQQQNAS